MIPYIYKTTNLINGKIYIGQCNHYYYNYLGSGTTLKKAIKKYGKENFKVEIIKRGEFNQTFLNELERHFIRLYNSTNKNIGYNIETGGTRGEYKRTRETKDKIRKALTGRKLSKEHIEKLKIARKNDTWKHTEEFKKRIGEFHKNRIRSEEEIIKSANNRIGVKRTEEQKQKMRLSNRKSLRPVLQYSLEGKLLNEFISIKEATRFLNLKADIISDHLRGRGRKNPLFIFKYKT